MAYLYQEIMNVPGLSGSWKDRNAQLYEKLGSPLGSYKGNYDQNIWLLNQLKKNNYYKSGLPGTTTKTASTPTTTTKTSTASQYAQPGVTAGTNANQPSFQETLPFYEAWQGMVPQATQAAESQINPEAQREFKSTYNDYMAGLTSSGGQRFGRGLMGGGQIRADTERNRQAQLQDWLNQYQQGYKTIFYEPAQTAWNQAITSGQAPDQSLAKIPTWNDLYDKYSNLYGVTTNNSPFYG